MRTPRTQRNEIRQLLPGSGFGQMASRALDHTNEDGHGETGTASCTRHSGEQNIFVREDKVLALTGQKESAFSEDKSQTDSRRGQQRMRERDAQTARAIC